MHYDVTDNIVICSESMEKVEKRWRVKVWLILGPYKQFEISAQFKR